ncbi:hypothetical protein P7L87_26115, partial [Vibrio parahaemolyticus]|nr:hypothetical protein [Vibrio parahaemolyticus]
ELIAAVRGRMIEVPVVRGVVPTDMIRGAEEARAGRVGQVSDREARALGQPVLMTGKEWGKWLQNDREERAARQPRVAPTDLSPQLQEAHAKALEASRLDTGGYATIAGRVKSSSARRNVFHITRRLNTKSWLEPVAPLHVKQAVFRKEMKAYEEALYRSGISREDRHQLVVREAKQKAAEWGMDYDVARSSLSSVQRRAFKQAARHEARVAKLAAGIEVDGIRFGRKPPARDLSGLTLEETKAHEAAVTRVNAVKFDVAGIVSDLERARAFDTAQPGQATDQARSRVAMTKVEVAWVVAGEQTRIYAAALSEAGLPAESVQRLADREAIYRAALLGRAEERSVREHIETNYALVAHNRHRDRLDNLGAAIAAGRGEGGDRFAQYDLTDIERQAHERALTASRL